LLEENIPMSVENAVTPDKIMQIGLGFWASKALLSAVEVGLFSALSGGPLDAPALIQKLGLHGRGALDFFDTLVSLGMLEREGEKYRNTPETAQFLVSGKPAYIGGFLEMANSRLYPFWGNLTEGLRTGLPQNEVKSGGEGLFEALYGDPERLRLFLGAMTGLSLGAGRAMAAKFPWADYQTLLDVGGAQGGLLAQVCLAHPHLRGTNFDLPMVEPIFKEYAAEQGLSERLSFHAGDFFREELPSADVIVMGHILHDWDMDQKRMLIEKVYRALPDGGVFIIFEALIDDERRQNTIGLLMSLNMLIETPGGFDYTGKDCAGWLRAAGFHDIRVEHLIGPDSMVIAVK
jgi:hypothetical protein